MMTTMTQKTFHFRPADRTVQDDDDRTDRQSCHLNQQEGTHSHLIEDLGQRFLFRCALLFNQCERIGARDIAGSFSSDFFMW